ncbi:hypothetical protein PENSPDRAFT_541778, partial [Peniophora sp. CONT]
WRCLDCFGRRDMCITCICTTHLDDPFHRVAWYNGRHFRGSWLSEAGCAIYLCANSSYGSPCPHNKQAYQTNITTRVPSHLRRPQTEAHSDSKAAPQDLHNFPVMVLIHANGVHNIGVNFCRCPNHLSDDLQLLSHGLYPASRDRPSTAFHMRSMDTTLIDHLECRTSNEAGWKKLCRLTVPENPKETPNRYPVMLRVIREYRAIVQLDIFGFIHQAPGQWTMPGDGELCWPCIACPNEFNLPEEWNEMTDEERTYYFYAWVLDGNMKAEHTLSRRPDNNVQIFSGAGQLPDPVDFASATGSLKTDKGLPAHLEPCHQHKAAAATGSKTDPSKDIRGILSVCCARHGSILRGATVNIDSSEKYAQADYALNRTMRLNMSDNVSNRFVLGYDIVCQYLIHLLLRFQHFDHLEWPHFIHERTGIVGVWHIFAHVPECFGRFASLYGWGIGIIDGEILETLWSLLNLITESCRNMSLANREETISFFIADMNFKKLIDFGMS